MSPTKLLLSVLPDLPPFSAASTSVCPWRHHNYRSPQRVCEGGTGIGNQGQIVFYGIFVKVTMTKRFNSFLF